ncbi:hypothetical protein VPHD249_0115 [Vibrio phage D249]|nr:hypothetical protein SIPHO036v1_90018 [Vibrio phage 70E38.1]QZI88011.1 hypothetical protein SIPHO041v1_p0100 [Vibrio phage 234P1]QZI88183.1 hypothetical protein SIPHO035v1_p0092 [Vibrio phage 234P7B]QZI88349.1 hypothetical protein SIPHO082v1_p0072 [Vibrio phage 294E48.1]QZI88550.1 hypothetical protein SIPHO037v1_p0109 [Vibrio phage 70E35.2]QZI88735.1 hypothetical protein SIPHO039v1_p0106 [Vibrio phage 70E35.5a]QZI88918.1 hypothetical protein SIPHO040v1_p0105 [Vibrio phage 70E35.6]QZI89102
MAGSSVRVSKDTFLFLFLVALIELDFYNRAMNEEESDL